MHNIHYCWARRSWHEHDSAQEAMEVRRLIAYSLYYSTTYTHVGHVWNHPYRRHRQKFKSRKRSGNSDLSPVGNRIVCYCVASIRCCFSRSNYCLKYEVSDSKSAIPSALPHLRKPCYNTKSQNYADKTVPGFGEARIHIRTSVLSCASY